jgi:hypothetical protein
VSRNLGISQGGIASKQATKAVFASGGLFFL